MGFGQNLFIEAPLANSGFLYRCIKTIFIARSMTTGALKKERFYATDFKIIF
jgi:hypothetical protein